MPARTCTSIQEERGATEISAWHLCGSKRERDAGGAAVLTHLVGTVPADLWARSPAALLDMELAHERASSLGRLGRRLEATLQALVDFNASYPLQSASSREDQPSRAALVREAARALWYLIVQRESCGLCDGQAVMENYRVPAEVQYAMNGSDVESGPRQESAFGAPAGVLGEIVALRPPSVAAARSSFQS